MAVAVYIPLLAALLLGASTGALGRALPPATAARALAGSALLVAAASSFVLGVLAFTLLATLPPIAALGQWSVASLTAANPVPELVAGLACAAVLIFGARGTQAAVSRYRALAAVRAICLHLGGEPGQLIVVDDDTDEVYAVPGAGGRIVASRALLAALPVDERRALLAHEAAHLHHHHHRYRVAAELAAALNPLLRPTVGAVRFATERWADEDAALATGDRAVVARALARTGLRKHGARSTPAGWRAVALDAAESAVVARVRALLAPPPRRRPAALLILAALMAVTLSSTVEAQRDAEQLFEQSRPAIASAAAATATTHI